MHIEIRQLRYFLAVAEELHFGRAADRLHMTQPPLSQAIRQLEDELGAPLFDRNRRGVALTPAGLALLPEAKRLVEAAGGLYDIVRAAAQGETGRLALAFITSATYSMLPSLLGQFRAAYPGVDIRLLEATSDVQFEELLHGRIDCGFVIPPLPERAMAELDYMPVLQEPLVAAVPAGRLPPGPVRVRDLPDLPLVVFPRAIAPGLYDAILGLLHDAGRTPAIGQRAMQMQTIVSLVSAGMGMALVPQSVSNLMRPGVEYRPLKEATPQVETGLAWRRDNDSPVLRSFLETLRKNALC